MRILTLLLILFSTAAYADGNSSLNLALPSVPQSYQSDRFKTGDLDCSNAIGSATNLEFGVTGIIDNGGWDPTRGSYNDTRTGDVGVYARITIPLGAKARSRIDCNQLYELELQKKRLEVMKLQRELEQLRALQFED